MLRHVATKLRNALRRWLGVVDPTPTNEPPPPPEGLSIAQALLAKAGEKNLVYRKVAPPQLMPGVIPSTTQFTTDPGYLGPFIASDSELLAPAYSYANQAYCGLGFPGYAYLAELSQRSEYRSPSETIASEMTREFIALVVKGTGRRKNKPKDKAKQQDDDLGFDAPAGTDAPVEGDDGKDSKLEEKITLLTEALEEFKVREALNKCAELDGLFGRAQIFIDLDYGSRDRDEMRQLPLVIDKETIKKGMLKALTVVEPIWTTPFTYNASDPTAPDFYKPKAWFVLGKRTHASRLLTFIMREVPDILKPAYNFGGLSMTQLMESYVFRWLRTSNSISDLIHNFSVMALSTDMTAILAGKADKPGGLLDRAKLFVATRDNQGLTLLDKDKEELNAVNVPLSGLEGLQAQSQEQMAGPSHIPLVKLLGITPTGLNASSEGEIKVFYDFVRACQQKFFGEHLNTILQILQLHLFGEIDDAIGFEFKSLSSPTVKELAEIRKADADTAAVYIDKGVISPDEVREKVNNDPDSGFDNLTGDAPEPPEVVGMGAEAELNEEAAQANHARGEESAEAAHERQLEADKAAAKNKPKAAA
jgi:phage-related protein (TIGR01555 family)